VNHSRTFRRRRERGFSLIELLIVVAVIGIICAIAVPNLLSAKQPAHNASAIASLKQIHTAQIAYRARNGQFGSLADLANAGILTDPLLTNGSRSNYTFVIDAATLGANNFEVRAAPSVAPWRYYYMDGTGIIRSNMGGAAGSGSPAINY
jgi:type IV pilus assembly protein PilA